MTMTVDPSVPRKLAFKDGMRILLLDPPEGYREALAAVAPGCSLELPGDATGSGARGAAAEPFDAVQLFCPDVAALERRAPDGIAAVRHDGLLWIAYPKGGSGVTTDLKRDVIPPVLAPLGYRPVAQVALDATWSALRFRPSDLVGR